MQNSLSPAFVRINAVSAYGPHTFTYPSVPINANALATNGYDFVLRGAELPHDSDDAIKDFVNLLSYFYHSTFEFTDYLLYSQPTPDDIPNPVAGAALGYPGVGTVAGWDKATQQTWTYRTDQFGVFKIVMLDMNSTNDFGKVTAIPGSGLVHDLNAYVTADASWLAGRDGGAPKTFLQYATTLNEKLRRAYRMN